MKDSDFTEEYKVGEVNINDRTVGGKYLTAERYDIPDVGKFDVIRESGEYRQIFDADENKEPTDWVKFDD